MMEFGFPSLAAWKPIGFLTKTSPAENKINATGTPFRAPSLLTDQVGKTCTELTVRRLSESKIEGLAAAAE